MEENYTEFKLDFRTEDIAQRKRVFLLQTQLRWLNKNRMKVYDMAYHLYSLYMKNGLPRRVKERCCNFPLLEERCVEYSKEQRQKIFC